MVFFRCEGHRRVIIQLCKKYQRGPLLLIPFAKRPHIHIKDQVDSLGLAIILQMPSHCH